jgi:hypothetical protein
MAKNKKWSSAAKFEIALQSIKNDTPLLAFLSKRYGDYVMIAVCCFGLMLVFGFC